MGPRVGRFVERLIDLAKRTRAWLRLRDWDWVNACFDNGVNLGRVAIRPGKTLSIRLEKGEIVLSKCTAAFELLSSYQALLNLGRLPRGEFFWDARHCALSITYNGVLYSAKNCEEVEILSEVLCEGVYDLIVNDTVTILDVGANVGFTSLYLASINRQAVIHAFEPLLQNIERARSHFDANPELSSRINLHPYGLFDKEGVMDIVSPADRRGCSSIVLDRSEDEFANLERARINVRSASEVIENIARNRPGSHVLLKMDCEGSEYSILQALEKTGTIKLIDSILLEWHLVKLSGLGADYLKEYFIRNGFSAHFRNRNIHEAPCGMAYAFRHSHQKSD